MHDETCSEICVDVIEVHVFRKYINIHIYNFFVGFEHSVYVC